MAFKSQAQQNRAAAQVAQGKMTQADYDRHLTDTPAALPERTTWPKGPVIKEVKILRAQKVRK